jgi:hypothetical protein
MRDPAEAGVEVLVLIPQSAGIGDLRGRAPEKHGGEIRHPSGVAQRFQDQPDRFSAARGAQNSQLREMQVLAITNIGLPRSLLIPAGSEPCSHPRRSPRSEALA